MRISKDRINRIILEEIRRVLIETGDLPDNVIDFPQKGEEAVVDIANIEDDRNFNPFYDPYPEDNPELMRGISSLARASDVEAEDEEFEKFLAGVESEDIAIGPGLEDDDMLYEFGGEYSQGYGSDYASYDQPHDLSGFSPQELLHMRDKTTSPVKKAQINDALASQGYGTIPAGIRTW